MKKATWKSSMKKASWKTVYGIIFCLIYTHPYQPTHHNPTQNPTHSIHKKKYKKNPPVLTFLLIQEFLLIINFGRRFILRWVNK
jgi:hypothetical protein